MPRAADVLPPTFAELLGHAPPPPVDEAPLLAEFASRHGVNDVLAPLDRAGLPRDVHDGALTIHVRRLAGPRGDQVVNESHRIPIQGASEEHGTSLQDVLVAINRIGGLKATTSDDGRLVIQTTDRSLRFRLADEGSGLLEALGQDATPRRQAFDQFVGQSLYGQMVASMRKTVGKAPYFHGGRAEEVFQSQLDQQLVERLTSAKGGELAQALYQQQFHLPRLG